MAVNFIQEGDTLTITAPAAIASGDGVLVGSLFGVAKSAAASGAELVIATAGVWRLVKATGQAWTVGARVYWDDGASAVTTTASGNKLIGVVVEAAASGAALGVVRLNGSFSQ